MTDFFEIRITKESGIAFEAVQSPEGECNAFTVGRIPIKAQESLFACA